MSLAQHFSSESLWQTADHLSDRELSFERHREEANKLVLNLVVKYLASYLGVACTDYEQMHAGIKARLVQVRAQRGSLKDVVLAGLMAGLGVEGRGFEVGDSMSVECLSDVPASAAIVKELIFNQEFRRTFDFLSADIGSGTGILLLATVIAARRAGISRITGIGFEREMEAVSKGNRVLRTLLRRNEEATIQHVDVTSPGLFAVFDGFPLNFWVSETFSCVTPRLEVRRDHVELVGDEMARAAARAQAILDPFHIVAMATAQERPHFIRDVREGTTAMFPNIVNGQFVPDAIQGARIQLKTGVQKSHVPLYETGREFWPYGELEPGMSRDIGKMRFPPA